MLSQYQAEAQILKAQQTKVAQLRNAVDHINPSIEVEESFVEFPFSKILGEEAWVLGNELKQMNSDSQIC